MTTTDTPERTAQGLSFQKGGDHRNSWDRMNRSAFEAWFRDLAQTDARLRDMTLTPELIETCWGEYDGGAKL